MVCLIVCRNDKYVSFFQFVLTATGSEAEKVIASRRKKWNGNGLGRIPIFVSADYLS